MHGTINIKHVFVSTLNGYRLNFIRETVIIVLMPVRKTSIRLDPAIYMMNRTKLRLSITVFVMIRS